MEQTARDQMLLAILEPEDREDLLALVEQFVTQELGAASEEQLILAAALFERRAEERPECDRLVGLQFAAALRLRIHPGAVQ